MPVKTSEPCQAAARASGLPPSGPFPGPAAEPCGRPPAAFPCAHDPLLGRVLGQYRILEKLGAGGMGQVYLAEHRLMKRRVALKVVTGPGNDGEAGALFRREVEAAAQLRHPNIVTAFDADEADGIRFLVMEYVEGVDLRRLVAEAGPLPVALACDCIRQAALGLQHAHERGFLHGDIKPANLLIHGEGARPASWAAGKRPDCGVKLLDLGLARATQPSPGAELPSPAELAGTPDFLAPELAQDPRTADVRTDLYSLGCAFYFLLTGRPPFAGETWTETLLHHQFDQAVPVRQFRGDVPAELVTVVDYLMAKDPAARYPDAAAVATVLQAWLTAGAGQRPPALPVRRPYDTPLPWDTLGGTAGAGAAGRETEGDGAGLPALRTPYSVLSTQDTPSSSPLSPECRGGSLSGQTPSWDGPIIPEHDVALLRTADLAGPTRRRLPLPAALTAAVTLGLLTAWFARQPGSAETAPSRAVPVRTVTPAFAIEGRSQGYATLAAALAGASDGDTIVVGEDGPFLTEPLELRGKAVTIKAAAGFRPSLRLAEAAREGFWQPLLASDRSLTLEGLDLQRGEPSGVSTGPAHLLSCRDDLHLIGCRLDVPCGSAAVVCRGSKVVEWDDCSVTVDALALCVEVGEASPSIRLKGNTIRVRDPHAAALSIWSADVRYPAPVQVTLQDNRVQAGRIAAFASLVQGVEVEGHGNEFTFHEALLSYAGFPGADGWRRATVWRGHDNVYRGDADWLCVDGVAAGVRDSRAWRELWDGPGAVTRASLPPVQAARAGVPD